MTKLVYLDSSDFSNLSAPHETLSRDNQRIIACLREHKQAGTALFLLSGAHISEAVHAAETYKPAAVRRAKLMRELCGTNILRFPNSLATAELRKLLSGSHDGRLSFDEIKSNSGSWFGVDVSTDGMADNRENIRREILGNLDRLPRGRRRKLKSELSFEKRSGQEKWRELLKSGAQSVVIPFPLNLIERDLAISWLLGQVSNLEFRARVIEIVSDPYILFEYVVDATENRQRLYDSFRPKALFSDDEHERQVIGAMLPFAKTTTTPDIKKMANEFFERPATLRKIISSCEVDAGQFSDGDLPITIRACPSLFTIVQIYKSVFEARFSSYLSRIRMGNTEIKKSKPSDFGDIMHCSYAPYFDVFRCDVAFGAHLKGHSPIKAKIADHIGDLPRMLSDTP